ncbi:hypothetical protein BV22DRAFT_1041531 [Leucogyrophana mollusca]|uniref:Uncharacterized protein n=1 Tax=Leucogyrophana mollusca TaxID=85980 RepID=A0ACB8AYW7_9AGAM|nr:hypothetical protein BV22DRAFT_1041531 [Leucogyrophana mollusca]
MPDTETIDWDELRALSLRPGGFGEDRVRIWTALLHAEALSSASTASSSTNETSTTSSSTNKTSEPSSPTNEAPNDDDDTEPHRDERQIRLDTDRSFVMYPPTEARDPLQLDLYRLLVSVFRRRRKLHYFQGYHDIITVLFLTLPPELHLRAAEHLSLHRLRDSMGPSLEPVLALLRILKNLLRLADPQLADILESTSPLPYHALPALLTLLAHDTPTLPLIQHIFDWLLCRPPEAVVWLVAAVSRCALGIV